MAWYGMVIHGELVAKYSQTMSETLTKRGPKIDVIIPPATAPICFHVPAGVRRSKSSGTLRSLRWMILLIFLIFSSTASAKVYHVATDGSGDFSTISQVNAVSFVAGDVILFRKGDTWREQLIPRSGDINGHITYCSYGEGGKPLLVNSVNMHDVTKWIYEGSNIWTSYIGVTGKELLPNSTFKTNKAHWSTYVVSPSIASISRTTSAGEFDTAPGAGKLTCTENGGSIELWTGPISINKETWYEFSFRAKASKPFSVKGPNLIKTIPPYTVYSSYNSSSQNGFTFTNSWKTYTVYYKANVKAADARIDLRLDNMPRGSHFYFDTLSFKRTTQVPLYADVGNIDFNNDRIFGVKKWNEEDLARQGDYWYDEVKRVVKIYSISNPATFYTNIECALRQNIIDQSNGSYIIYDGLALKLGAAHGIGGGNTHHIIVRNCDFSYIGGGDQYGGTRTVRFGNGLEFWANSHDNLVEKCRFWEIYDGGYSDEYNGTARVNKENNILRNSIFWNCHHSISTWNSQQLNNGSTLKNIYIYNNTCLFAGREWSCNQRPDGDSAWHWNGWGGKTTAIVENIVYKNNIAYESTLSCCRLMDISQGVIYDNNIIYQTTLGKKPIYYRGASYTLAEWQAISGQDRHSIASDPLLNTDNSISDASPAKAAGCYVPEVADDFRGIPRANPPSIGAYEYVEPSLFPSRSIPPVKLNIK